MSVRDLTIGIDFNEIDVHSLTMVDKQIDRIEDKLESLDSPMRQAGNSLKNMSATGSTAMRELSISADGAGNAFDELGDGMGNIGDNLDVALSALEAELRGATSEVNSEMDGMRSNVERNNQSIGDSFRDLTTKATISLRGIGLAIKGGLISSLPAAIPMVAALGTGVMALGASALSAGAGMVGFGAVAVGVLGDVFTASEELSEAQKAFDMATTGEERTAALEAQAEALAGLSDAQKEAVTSLQDFKSYWGEFTASFETPVVGIFGKSLDLLQSILDKMKPAISGAMTAVDGLIDKMSVSLEGADMQNFFTWLGNTAGPMLTSFGVIAGNILRGIMNLFVAFSPLSADVQGGLEGMTASFADWSANLSKSDGFQQFITYVTENTPVMLSLFGKIGQVIGELVTTLAPVGSAMLEVFNSVVSYIQTNFMPVFVGIRDTVSEFYSFLSDVGVIDLVKSIFDDIGNAIKTLGENMTNLLPIIVGAAGAFAAFKVITTIASAMRLFNTVMIAYRTGTLLATVAQWGLNAAMLANPFTWIAIAIGAVIAIAVLLWQNWDLVKEKALQLWAAVKIVWAGIWSAVTEAWNNIVTVTTVIWSIIWSTIVSIASAIWNWLKAAWSAGILILQQNMTMLWTAIVAIWNFGKNLVVSIATAIWTGIVAVFNFLVTSAVAIWNGLVNTIKFLWSAFMTGLLFTANLIWTGLQNIWNWIKLGAITIWTALVTGITTIFSTLWGWLSAAATTIWTGLQNIWNMIKTGAITAWTMVSTGIQTAFQTAKTFVMTIAQTIWQTISDKFNQVLTTVTTIWNNVKDAISTALDSAWTSVQNFFSPLADLIDKVKGAWDKLTGAFSNFSFPDIKVPSWMSKVGGFISGSHATGLERVPYDGYVAELHKDEAVLTADQSNTLRNMGMLTSRGVKPELNIPDAPTGDMGGGTEIGGYDGDMPEMGSTTNNSSTNYNNFEFNPNVEIVIEGRGDDDETLIRKVRAAARAELEEMFRILKQQQEVNG